MLNLDKINSQVNNLKEMDTAQLVKVLVDNQNLIIKYALIALSLLIAANLFNNYHVQEQAINLKIKKNQEKLEAIKSRDSAIEALNNFKSSLPPKLNEFEFTSLVSKYGKLNHIRIPSLSPGQIKDMGLYDVIDLDFSAEANNFKDMMLFLRKLEKSEYPLRIDSWVGTEDADGKMNFQIQVKAVLIHT